MTAHIIPSLSNTNAMLAGLTTVPADEVVPLRFLTVLQWEQESWDYTSEEENGYGLAEMARTAGDLLDRCRELGIAVKLLMQPKEATDLAFCVAFPETVLIGYNWT